MSGAVPVTVSRAREFDLCGMRVIVAEIEGTVQMLFGVEGWPADAGGATRRKVMANVFAHTTTPAELRALADHLDGLALEAPMEELGKGQGASGMSGCIVKIWLHSEYEERNAKSPFLIIETELPDFATFCEMVDQDRLIGGAVLFTARGEVHNEFIIQRRFPIAFRGGAVMRCQLPGHAYVEGVEA